METKKITNEMRALIDAPLPDEAVSQHPSKSFLSTIKSIYVTERLNDVFGVGTWKLTTEPIEREGKMVVVKTTLTIPDYGIHYESYGGNDNADLGDAYKGASTDALTKIGSWMGIGADVFKGKQTGKGKAKFTPTATPIKRKVISERTIDNPDQLQKMLDILDKGWESNPDKFDPISHLLKLDFEFEGEADRRVYAIWQQHNILRA